jgi:hypothetical protein
MLLMIYWKACGLQQVLVHCCKTFACADDSNYDGTSMI